MTAEEAEAVRIYVKLSERQRDVLRLLISGVTNYRAMAARLGISKSTVCNHTQAVMQLTRTSDRTGLVLFVLRRPILERFLQQGVTE